MATRPSVRKQLKYKNKRRLAALSFLTNISLDGSFANFKQVTEGIDGDDGNRTLNLQEGDQLTSNSIAEASIAAGENASEPVAGK